MKALVPFGHELEGLRLGNRPLTLMGKKPVLTSRFQPVFSGPVCLGNFSSSCWQADLAFLDDFRVALKSARHV
jgi:hypothetical protein